jgi:alpha-galactosidase
MCVEEVYAFCTYSHTPKLSKLNATQLAILKNAELLAFSQDTTVGTPAKPYKTGTTTPPEYYAGKSVKGTHVFVMNVGSTPASKVVTFAEVSRLYLISRAVLLTGNV